MVARDVMERQLLTSIDGGSALIFTKAQDAEVGGAIKD
jgi:hypothetical protein